MEYLCPYVHVIHLFQPFHSYFFFFIHYACILRTYSYRLFRTILFDWRHYAALTTRVRNFCIQCFTNSLRNAPILMLHKPANVKSMKFAYVNLHPPSARTKNVSVYLFAHEVRVYRYLYSVIYVLSIMQTLPGWNVPIEKYDNGLCCIYKRLNVHYTICRVLLTR